MKPGVIFQKAAFRLRRQVDIRPVIRKAWWELQGARFGKGTVVSEVSITWPHQVAVGANCILEDDIFFKYDGYWQPGPSIVLGDRVFVGKGCEFNIRCHVEIGSDCLIASNCKFIDHNHEMTAGLGPMHSLLCPEDPIVLENDVWLGVNVIVLKGVTIGEGAIVGASAVVTKSIAPFEIWAGIPARKIGERPRAESARSYETLHH